MKRDLLTQIKDKLRITWDYQDDELMELIEEAKAFISSRVTIENIEENQNAIKLLKEYCRYSWSGSANQFAIDYSQDILNLQIEIAIKGSDDND